MIGRLTGRIVECSPGQVLLDVAGVGYDVLIPLSTYYRVHALPPDAVSLHVHTHVRDDALVLFGFSSRQERAAFELLISISGVGPRLALAILSGIGADELQGTVRAEDHHRLQKIPGVGKKTAERVVLELRDKIDRIQKEMAPGSAEPAAAPASGSGQAQRRDDGISALVNLGYPKERAERAIKMALKELGAEAALESVLKTALGSLVR